MNVERFIAVRRTGWERLNELLERVETRGVAVLTSAELHELYRLYREACTDLNYAQTMTGNPAVLDFLEALVARGYATVATPEKVRPFRAWWRVMRHGFVATLRRRRLAFAIASLSMLAGVAFGWITTAVDPDLTRVFLPAEHLVQTPSERVEELEAMEARGDTRIDNVGDHALFTSSLFTHNIRVSVLALALGMTFGVGTVVVLFYNGVIIGSIARDYLDDGVFEFFVAWVGPHGAIEIPCIIFAGTAGLVLAQAQWSLAGGPVLTRIARVRADVLTLIVGAATLLVAAGLIEGGFSQVNEPTIPYELKIGVAAALFACVCGYVAFLPVREQESLRELTRLDRHVSVDHPER